MLKTRSRLLGILLLSFTLIGGCANYGDPKNLDITEASSTDRYSLSDWDEGNSTEYLTYFMAFSGGGTRAAALSYGVRQELRDTRISVNGQDTRLLEEIDHISSVSGGSFTSAYYGLHGEHLFENFENNFLRFNLEKHLYWRAINPALLFSKKGRTESAIEYYQQVLSKGARFADMNQPDRPIIIINASDLGYGIRFSFIQEYFDLLCSDLASFPLAEAVAASSAVPILRAGPHASGRLSEI